MTFYAQATIRFISERTQRQKDTHTRIRHAQRQNETHTRNKHIQRHARETSIIIQRHEKQALLYRDTRNKYLQRHTLASGIHTDQKNKNKQTRTTRENQAYTETKRDTLSSGINRDKKIKKEEEKIHTR